MTASSVGAAKPVIASVRGASARSGSTRSCASVEWVCVVRLDAMVVTDDVQLKTVYAWHVMPGQLVFDEKLNSNRCHYVLSANVMNEIMHRFSCMRDDNLSAYYS